MFGPPSRWTGIDALDLLNYRYLLLVLSSVFSMISLGPFFLICALSDTLCSNGTAKVGIFFFLANYFKEIFQSFFARKTPLNVLSH